MKVFLFSILLACSTLTGLAENASPIDFTSGHNLKVVFDAGVRPWRLQGLESDQCIVTDQPISLLFTDSQPFSLDAQIVTFKVLAGNELTGMDVISEVMPIPDAINKAHEIYNDLGMDPKPLDNFIDGLGKVVYPRLYWEQRVQKGDQYIQVNFMPLATPDFATAQIYVTADFGPRGQPMKFLTGPIQPPPGYENVSMDPPPLAPSPHPFPGTHDAEYYFKEAKEKGLNPLTSTPEQIEAAPYPQAKPSGGPTPNTPAPHPSTPPSPTHHWLLALLILALGIWWLLRRK